MDLVSKEVKDDAKVFNMSGVQTPYKTQDIEEVLGKPEEKGEFCMNFEFTPSKSENTESKEWSFKLSEVLRHILCDF